MRVVWKKLGRWNTTEAETMGTKYLRRLLVGFLCSRMDDRYLVGVEMALNLFV